MRCRDASVIFSGWRQPWWVFQKFTLSVYVAALIGSSILQSSPSDLHMPMSGNNGHSTSAAQAVFGPTRSGVAGMEVLSFATADDPGILLRPCVDCGVTTGRFCDYCYAVDRFPNGDATGRGWAPGQLTPLCSNCDKLRDGCRFCWDIWVTKPVEIYKNASTGSVPAGPRASYSGSIPLPGVNIQRAPSRADSSRD